MGKVVITIGRQFGSGGHKIGEYLSNRLGLSYYDNELILLAAQRGDLKIEHVEEMDEALRKAGHRVLSIFISAPLPQRIARTCRLQGISKEECETLTERKDSSRKAYYEKHTGRKWGVPENYDLYYDTSQNDIAYIIVDIIKKYKQMCSE